MKRNQKILSIQLSTQELAAIDAEAQAFPFLGNRSEYARTFIIGRHQVQVEAAPETQRLIDHYTQLFDQRDQEHQTERDQLAADYQAKLDRLQARLARTEQALEASEEQLEAIVQANDENVKSLIDCSVDKLKLELTVKQLQDELTTAHKNEQQWKTDCQQLKAQLKESQKGQKQVENTANVIKAVEQLLTANPGISQGIEQGLGRLFAPKPSEPPKAEPSEATKLGETIARDFPGAQLSTIVTFLRYLRDTPQEKNAVLAQPGFVAYQVKSRAAHQQQTTKSQGKKQ